jgi:hypothetical protein
VLVLGLCSESVKRQPHIPRPQGSVRRIEPPVAPHRGAGPAPRDEDGQSRYRELEAEALVLPRTVLANLEIRRPSVEFIRVERRRTLIVLQQPRKGGHVGQHGLADESHGFE